MKQDAYFAQGECCFYLRDFVGVVACLKRALEAAPGSSKTANIQAMIERFSPTAEAQETVAKAAGQLDAAQGLDRAKLLDQLIEARTKLAQAVPDPTLAQDVEKWSREIVALDAENKAGLKNKYELRVHMAEAQNLLRAEKWDEAHAVLDKALAVPGLAGEPLQELYAAKANCYASQNDFEKARDACQKALEAAPNSPQVQMIGNLLQRAESELAKQKTKEQTPAAEPEAPVAEAKTQAAAEAQKPAAAK